LVITVKPFRPNSPTPCRKSYLSNDKIALE